MERGLYAALQSSLGKQSVQYWAESKIQCKCKEKYGYDLLIKQIKVEANKLGLRNSTVKEL